jgi:hypothetical protein
VSCTFNHLQTGPPIGVLQQFNPTEKENKKVMAHILGFGHKNQTNPPPTENGRKIKTK